MSLRTYDPLTKTIKLNIDFVNSNNVVIGHNSQNCITSGYDNCVVIGNNAHCTANAQVQLGSTLTNTYSYGGVQLFSDARDKTDIRDTTLGLNFIDKLHPVDFKWNYRRDYTVPTGNYIQTEQGYYVPEYQDLPNDGSKTRTRYHHGLIAQEVKTTMDELGTDFGGYQDHTVKNGEEQLTISYTELIAPMIKAIQELKAEVESLKAKLS